MKSRPRAADRSRITAGGDFHPALRNMSYFLIRSVMVSRVVMILLRNFLFFLLFPKNVAACRGRRNDGMGRRIGPARVFSSAVDRVAQP